MNTKFNYRTLFAVLAVDLLATTGDSTATWSSPMLVKLESNDTDVNPLGKPITSDEESWIGSLVGIGAMFGPFFFGFVSGKFGRRIALLGIAIPHLIAYLTLSFAKNIYLYYFSRIFGGFAVGGGYTLMPMYIAEVTEHSNRGLMSVTLNIFWCFGNFLPYLVGPFLSAMWLNLLLACLPATFFIIFFFLGPETPYYLVMANKIEKAEESLKELRTNNTEDSLKKELEHIKETVDKDNENRGSITDLIKTKSLQKALLISTLLVIFQQTGGITCVLFYLEFIFKSSCADIPSEIAQIIFGSVLFVASFVAPFLTDKWGRRPLLIVSSIGVAISMATLGAFFYLLKNTNVDTKPIYWLPILCLVLYISFFNFGLGPIPWTVSSELFPSNVKSLAASLVAVCASIVAFTMTKLFNSMRNSMGDAWTFWFFSVSSTIAAVFSYFVVPETKGKSFMEIRSILEK